MGDNASLWAGLLVSAPGIAALLINLWTIYRARQRAPLEDAGSAVNTSKSAAEALKSYSDEIHSLRDELKDIQERVTILERENAELLALLDVWRAGIRRLLAQLVSANMTPVWQPEEGEGMRPTPPRR